MTEPTARRHRVLLSMAFGLALSTAFSRIETNWPILLLGDIGSFSIQPPACSLDILLHFEDAGITCHIGNMREVTPGACERFFPGSSRVCGQRDKMIWEREALYPNLLVPALTKARTPRRI